METEESLMICVDTSAYMNYLDPHRFELLIQCIRLYCQLQIELNPKIAIGILTMGCNSVNVILQPTRSIKEIMDELHYDHFGLAGPLKFIQGIKTSMLSLSFAKRRRIAMFTGGSYIDMNIEEAEYYGKLLKDSGVEVDLFYFEVKGDSFEFEKTALDAFVAAAVDEKTKHIAHISTEPTTTLEEIIPSAPQFFERATKDQVMIARREKAIDCKGDEEEEEEDFSNAWRAFEYRDDVCMPEAAIVGVTPLWRNADLKVPISEDGNSKRTNDTPPGAIDVESTSSPKKPRHH